MSFETDKIIKIINAVRKQECLWNVNYVEYAKRDRLERAWNEVAQEVGKSDVYCREKWRNVRTGFLRSVQHQIRINHDETVPKDFHTIKRKRFYLYDQMSFLLPSAESLELARKKRKLSTDRKYVMELENTQSSNGDNSQMPEYDTVGKFENLENDVHIHDEDLEADEEHHTFETTANATKDNEEISNADDSNYEEILKEMENMANGTSTTTTQHQHPQLQEQQSQNVEHSPTTNKVMRLISEQLNEEINMKSTASNPCHQHHHSSDEVHSSTFQHKILSPSNQRDEEQLINFFRGCIDDILSLDKRKQRQFKKRMLDLIDELHDS